MEFERVANQNLQHVAHLDGVCMNFRQVLQRNASPAAVNISLQVAQDLLCDLMEVHIVERPTSGRDAGIR